MCKFAILSLIAALIGFIIVNRAESPPTAYVGVLIVGLSLVALVMTALLALFF